MTRREKNAEPMQCRLCQHESVEWQRCDSQVYEYCQNCQQVQLTASQLPTLDEEKSCYDWHNNDPNDLGYRKFLSRLSTPLDTFLPKSACGLDYGCGPGPTLALMLRELGHHVANYDPIYFPSSELLQQQYDFISCSEVVEHFHAPAAEFDRLFEMLKEGGILAVMTGWRNDAQDFCRWHYRRDPTHVCFFNLHTFQWLAKSYHCSIIYSAPNVVLLSKVK